MRVRLPEMTGLGGQMSIVSSTERRTVPHKTLRSATAGRHGASLVSLARWTVGLVIDMDGTSCCRADWHTFDGGSAGKLGGAAPRIARMTAWSPDGTWSTSPR